MPLAAAPERVTLSISNPPSPASRNSSNSYDRSSGSPSSRDTTPGAANPSEHVSDGRNKIHPDETDLFPDPINRRSAEPDYVEFIIGDSIQLWDRNDVEEDYLFNSPPEDKERERQVARWKARKLAEMNGEIHQANEMSENSQTSHVRYDDGENELSALSEAEWYQEMGMGSTQLHIESQTIASPGPDLNAGNESESDVFGDLFGADEDMDTSTALLAEPSLHENAISPPSLPRGDSQLAQGTAVSISLPETPSPQALGSSSAPESSAPEFSEDAVDEIASLGLEAKLEAQLEAELDAELEADLEAELDKGLEEEMHAELEALFGDESQPYGQQPVEQATSTAGVAKKAAKKTIKKPAKKPAVSNPPVQLEENQPLGPVVLEDALKKSRSQGRVKKVVNRVDTAQERRDRQKSCRDRMRRTEKRPVQEQPLQKPNEIPKTYHNPPSWPVEADFVDLAKNLALQDEIDVKDCFNALGLDVSRGRDMLSKIRTHLKVPGNSIRVGSENVSSWGLQIAKVCHKLLVVDRWGTQAFNTPALNLKKCKEVKFDQNPTEMYMAFAKLLYHAAKMEEARRKGKYKKYAATNVASSTAQNQQTRAVVAITSNEENKPQERGASQSVATTSSAANAAPNQPATQYIDLTDLGDDDTVSTAPSPSHRSNKQQVRHTQQTAPAQEMHYGQATYPIRPMRPNQQTPTAERQTNPATLSQQMHHVPYMDQGQSQVYQGQHIAQPLLPGQQMHCSQQMKPGTQAAPQMHTDVQQVDHLQQTQLHTQERECTQRTEPATRQQQMCYGKRRRTHPAPQPFRYAPQAQPISQSPSAILAALKSSYSSPQQVASSIQREIPKQQVHTAPLTTSNHSRAVSEGQKRSLEVGDAESCTPKRPCLTAHHSLQDRSRREGSPRRSPTSDWLTY